MQVLEKKISQRKEEIKQSFSDKSQSDIDTSPKVSIEVNLKKDHEAIEEESEIIIQRY